MRKFLSNNKDFFKLVFWGLVTVVVFVLLFKACGSKPTAFDNDGYP